MVMMVVVVVMMMMVIFVSYLFIDLVNKVPLVM